MTARLSLVGQVASTRLGTGLAVALVGGGAVAVSIAAFGFSVPGALSLYFVVWWIVLFAVLPFGVRSQVEAGEVTPGSDPGSPAAPRLRERAIWTTVAASVVFVITVALLPYAGL